MNNQQKSNFYNPSNPWNDFSDSEHYYAKIDSYLLTTKKFANLDLRLDVLPEPYLGNPSSAEVIFLLLNPGFIEEDVTISMQNEYYIDQAYRSLVHESKTPFFLLDEKLSVTGGFKWWTKIISRLINDGASIENIRKKLMSVEYFPYHSVSYKHVNKVLPSQHYSFKLVRDSIAQKKIIVLMRGKTHWLNVVP